MTMRSLPFLLIACLALLFMIGGAEADEPLPLYGGPYWTEVDNEPPEVGDGALEVSWNQNDVETENLDISIESTGIGFVPADVKILVGTVVTWTNNDTTTHTVTDKSSNFDSAIGPGESWQMIFNDVGVYNYYCKYHPSMEGTINVLSDSRADERARTDFLEIWTAESNLIFWTNFNMSDDDTIEVVAQKKGHLLNSSESIPLNDQYGFSILCLSNGTTMGDSLIGSTDDEWKKYQIYLDSQKLGYNGLDYDPHDDNAYSFVFRIRGMEGSAAIGGVELIRTLDTGFYFGKNDINNLTYEIFPTLEVEIDYFAKNIGTQDNTFSMNPEVDHQGGNYEGAAFNIHIMVIMNGEEFTDISSSLNNDDTWTHEFDMASDDEAMITVRVIAPDYDTAAGEPAGNRKFDVIVNGYDTGSDDELREPMPTSLYIKPPQFILGEMTFNRASVIEDDSLEITAKVWNEGTYANDVLVVFYVIDQNGNAYSTPDGVQRMTRVASTTVNMAPKAVLENYGSYQTWYYATATWDEAFIPGTTVQDFETVEIYAQINPQLEQIDVDAGVKSQDEYLNQKGDNGGFGSIAVIKGVQGTESIGCTVTLDIMLRNEESDSWRDDACSDNEDDEFSAIANEDGQGTWTISFVKTDTEITVKSAHWYLLDEQGNTRSDGLVSDVYGYYSGHGKAVIFIDNDFNGKLSPGDKLEIHPGEPDSDLATVSDVTDYTLRIKIYYEYEAPPPPPPDATIYITQADDFSSYYFEPAILEINIGDTVQFIWGNGLHNVAQVSDSESNNYNSGFYSGLVQEGGNWNLPVEYTAQEGILYYICEPHVGMGMRGEIIVKGQNTTQNATLTAIVGENLITTIGSTIQFNGAGIDSDGVIVKYEWDFDGDGVFEYSSKEDGRTTNIYNKVGIYEATLRITDNDGNTANNSRIINVQEENDDSTEDDDEDESLLPSISLISSIAAIGIIALRRRY